MSPEGQYLLTPLGGGAEQLVEVSRGGPGSSSAGWGAHTVTALSTGYRALLTVFSFLSVRDRMAAGRTCRLWRDLSLHRDLWAEVCLKNTRVHDWTGFAQFFNRVGATRLDARKMLFVRDREETWRQVTRFTRSKLN